MEIKQGTQQSRVIARYKGHRRGPLLIVLGGIHGNEKAGAKAIRLVKKMLDVEPITKPDFLYSGNFIGLLGNVEAGKQKVRFIDRDLNRLWTKDNIKLAMSHDLKIQSVLEYRELRQLYTTIIDQIERYSPSKVLLLDLHTTSSDGGIFSIPSRDQESVRIAECLHAPVIHEILDGVEGTTLHFFQKMEIQGVQVTSVTFEAGQHKDPQSVNRCVAAILASMRAIGAVEVAAIESIHDQTLIEYSAKLPKKCRHIYKHSIKSGDHFKMEEGFLNFQKIKKGELLASDVDGPIYAKSDGRILMPLYQKKGEDGFFVIEDVE